MGKKFINKRQVHTEVDEKGNLSRHFTDEFVGVVDSEPDYIKIYLGTQLCLNNLDPNLAPYIIAFGPYMTYANNANFQHMVQTNYLVRENVAQTLNVSPKRVEQIIKLLVDSGIFIPVFHESVDKETGVITTTKKRGIYFVNPWVVAKGSWKDIKSLQQNIDFVRGESIYSISDESGTRKIKCKLPTNMEYKQITMDEYYQQGTEGEMT